MLSHRSRANAAPPGFAPSSDHHARILAYQLHPSEPIGSSGATIPFAASDEPLSFFSTERLEGETLRSQLQRLSTEWERLTAAQAQQLRTRLDRGDDADDVVRWLIEELGLSG
jgi:hypothetical protein